MPFPLLDLHKKSARGRYTHKNNARPLLTARSGKEHTRRTRDRAIASFLRSLSQHPRLYGKKINVMPKPIATTATGGDENDDGGVGNLRCLYDGERTKPIKTMKDKFELLPAFLKVRGLGAFFAFMRFCVRQSAGLVVDDAPGSRKFSLFFFFSSRLVCCSLFFRYTHKRGGRKRGVKNNTDGEPLLLHSSSSSLSSSHSNAFAFFQFASTSNRSTI